MALSAKAFYRMINLYVTVTSSQIKRYEFSLSVRLSVPFRSNFPSVRVRFLSVPQKHVRPVSTIRPFVSGICPSPQNMSVLKEYVRPFVSGVLSVPTKPVRLNLICLSLHANGFVSSSKIHQSKQNFERNSVWPSALPRVKWSIGTK